ncbi:MAG: cupin domain-containing protein [Litorilinea sp.]
MQQFNLLEKLEYREPDPFAQPLLVDKNTRILRFMLKPGQRIEEHTAPSSPFIAVVLQGTGFFSGPDGKEAQVGPNTLVHFGPNEAHSVRAGDEEFVFVGFLQGVEGTRPDHQGGELAKK